MSPDAIVLHGTTSAGKSSIAKVLQATAPVPAFHISLDAFVTMSNRRDMRSEAERDQAYAMHCENLRSTLARVAQTHFDIILDLVLRDQEELDACLQVLQGRPTCLVRVWATLDVLELRERSRDDRAHGMAREQIDHPAYRRSYDLEVDTSTCTPQEGAAQIRRFMQEKPRLTINPAGRLQRQLISNARAHNMKHRIAAGVIVENNNRILLVRHTKQGAYDFWVAPGGGVEGTEDLRSAARREVFEESGLHVEPLQLAYIEEFSNPHTRECKVWFTGRLVGGTISTEAIEAKREHITEAAWLSRGEFEGKTVFPPMLHAEYWKDRENGFAFPRYVGIRAMEFY
jgi:chloramphenicol 3-O-phosphotransferase/ADP-ribose pyrophosphatase YjhB (NUDIX family)